MANSRRRPVELDASPESRSFLPLIKSRHSPAYIPRLCDDFSFVSVSLVNKNKILSSSREKVYGTASAGPAPRNKYTAMLKRRRSASSASPLLSAETRNRERVKFKKKRAKGVSVDLNWVSLTLEAPLFQRHISIYACCPGYDKHFASCRAQRYLQRCLQQILRPKKCVTNNGRVDE